MVIAPVNALVNWENEIIKWTKGLDPLMVYNLASVEQSSRGSRIARWQDVGGILILGEQLFLALFKNGTIREKLQPDVLVLDEAHLMLKNSGTKVYKALSEIKTNRRLLLTGTPFQNNVSEYFRMVQFARPGAIDGIQTESEFEKKYRYVVQHISTKLSL